jgi:hypothetical protein
VPGAKRANASATAKADRASKRLEMTTNSQIRLIQTSTEQIIKSIDLCLKRFIRRSILHVKRD